MPHQTEPNANSALGSLLQDMLPRSSVRSENTQAMSGHPGLRPDFIVTVSGRSPVATVLPVKGYMGGVVGATQTVWFLQRALQSTSSWRMQAVRATSLGLPAATRRW